MPASHRPSSICVPGVSRGIDDTEVRVHRVISTFSRSLHFLKSSSPRRQAAASVAVAPASEDRGRIRLWKVGRRVGAGDGMSLTGLPRGSQREVLTISGQMVSEHASTEDRSAHDRKARTCRQPSRTTELLLYAGTPTTHSEKRPTTSSQARRITRRADIVLLVSSPPSLLWPSSLALTYTSKLSTRYTVPGG